MCSSTKSRPRPCRCSTAQSVNQSSPVEPWVKIEPGSSGSTGSPRSRSTDASAASNRAATPSGSGCVPSKRWIASARLRQSVAHRERERQRGRISRDRAGLDRQQQPHVGDGRRERAARGEIDPLGDRIAPDHAVRRLEAGQSAERGRDPDGTAAVRRGRDGGHAGRERGRRAAARTPRRPLGPPGVRRRSVEGVRREAGERELRLVRLPHDDRAGRPQPARHQSVGGRRGSVGERPGPVRRRHARHVFHVLHQEREAGERTGILAVLDPLVDRPSVVQRALSQPDHRVERRIQPLDPFERHPHQVGRRRAAGSDGGRELRQRHRSVTRSRTRMIVRLRLRSLRTTVDAFRPGTPITPPPGCVPPPQR